MSDFPKVPFEKGVVTAIYTGPDSLSEIITQLNTAKINVDPERIPRGSVVVRRVTRGADQAGSSFTLCYPFFSSHIQMPVKPSEMVWVIFDRDGSSIGYWITRVHGDETAEDTNFSHFDRNNSDSKQEVTTATKAGVATPSTGADDFPNISLAKLNDGNSYDLILSGASQSLSQTVFEPVPRYTRRPGDLVMQGSNNTTIALTTDHGWSTEADPTESATPSAASSPIRFSGTIDIVAGRSRWLSSGETGSRTIPPVRVNRRNFTEVSKRLADFENSLPAEGDPDFLDDASRIYISQQTEVDYNFGALSTTPAEFSTAEPPVDFSGASVAIKSDHLRFIARTDSDRSVNGSIRIIKEGVRDDDLAAIVISPDGVIQISGKEIHLGRSSADGGLEEGDSDAPGTSQPYVKYKQLEDLLKAVIADVKSFCDTVSTHTTPGYGAPSVQLNQAASALKSAMESRESEIPNLKSKRIFGE